MLDHRSSGIILHPTSLPGPDGIGDLGPGAYSWIDFLAQSETALWQVLPLNPTGYGDSPYQSFSAFAGNHYLISSELLLADGLLTEEDLRDRPDFRPDRVDFGPVINWKLTQLGRAYQNFKKSKIFKKELAAFKEEQGRWLRNYALFMALKDHHNGVPWTEWAPEYRDRDNEAIKAFTVANLDAIEIHNFWQFIFFQQWSQVRAYAHERGIKIIGDIPIYVAHDSSDVWANRELYYLDGKGIPTVVAGVPPDMFTADGQLWGNPIYNWEKHEATRYEWWVARLEAVLSLVDYIRLDHFRGFAGYYEIEYAVTTAREGVWRDGPGASFFNAIKRELGELPLIAEDLGNITPDVVELRKQFNLQGMKILTAGFGGDPDHEFLPHTYEEECVAYTGTHDNQTIVGWYQGATEEERDRVRRYLSSSGEEIAWDMIRALWASRANTAITSLQDLLSLDDANGRMNRPGTLGTNWAYRYEGGDLTDELALRLRALNRDYGRAQR
jgi:4-alpha-glucanotransferase